MNPSQIFGKAVSFFTKCSFQKYFNLVLNTVQGILQNKLGLIMHMQGSPIDKINAQQQHDAMACWTHVVTSNK
mgnify:CR=1 FL=1